jgi:hypothetical protein
MDKYIPLGAASPAKSKGSMLSVSPSKLDDRTRIKILEEQVRAMSRVIAKLKKKLKDQGNADDNCVAAAPSENLNKDGIPINTLCIGVTEKSLFPCYMMVREDHYDVGSAKFASLSAAAEAVSKVRRSGWTFWRLTNGVTLKEAFKDR